MLVQAAPERRGQLQLCLSQAADAPGQTRLLQSSQSPGAQRQCGLLPLQVSQSPPVKCSPTAPRQPLPWPFGLEERGGVPAARRGGADAWLTRWSYHTGQMRTCFEVLVTLGSLRLRTKALSKSQPVQVGSCGWRSTYRRARRTWWCTKGRWPMCAPGCSCRGSRGSHAAPPACCLSQVLPGFGRNKYSIVAVTEEKSIALKAVMVVHMTLTLKYALYTPCSSNSQGTLAGQLQADHLSLGDGQRMSGCLQVRPDAARQRCWVCWRASLGLSCANGARPCQRCGMTTCTRRALPVGVPLRLAGAGRSMHSHRQQLHSTVEALATCIRIYTGGLVTSVQLEKF